jgi:hypothetical protein
VEENRGGGGAYYRKTAGGVRWQEVGGPFIPMLVVPRTGRFSVGAALGSAERSRARERRDGVGACMRARSKAGVPAQRGEQRQCQLRVKGTQRGTLATFA